FRLAPGAFDARNAEPISGHPEFRKAAENAQRYGERHDEVPQRLGIPAEQGHQHGDDLRRSAAEDRSHQKARVALDTVLRGINSPQSADEEREKGPQTERENRPGFAAPQGYFLELFFCGLAADTHVAAQDTEQIMYRA